MPQIFRKCIAKLDFDHRIALRFVRRHCQLKEHGLTAAQAETDTQADVIIDAYVIESVLYFRQAMPEHVQRKRCASGANAVGKIIVETPVNEAGHPAVNG